jgi:uridine phosphorylase
LREDEPIFSPSDTLRWVAENAKIPVESIRAPERLIVTYHRRTYEHTKSLIDGKAVDWWMYGDRQPFCVGRFGDKDVGVGLFWVGAPATVMTLEEVIACGARQIFEVGVAGGLQTFLKPGDIVVVTEAIRDEGTSRHYLPPETKVHSSERLRERLISRLKENKTSHYVGPAWTTDAVYRETRGEFLKFKGRGVLAVDMETSAIFALAKYRNVDAVSAQVISDVLSESGWLQAFGTELVLEARKSLMKSILEAI